MVESVKVVVNVKGSGQSAEKLVGRQEEKGLQEGLEEGLVV